MTTQTFEDKSAGTKVFQIKSQLAKLLAVENVLVRHIPGAQTASFDVKNRVLNLPVWHDISEDLYDLLVVHEVGHALDTPATGWVEGIPAVIKKIYGKKNHFAEVAFKNFLNVVEDARIDKRQKRRYPGSRRNYTIGLKDLHARDFFGIKGKDVNALTFIDRANIYFKGGYDLGIKWLNDQERDFIKRMENAETWDEVMTLTEEIFVYAKENDQNQLNQTTQKVNIFIETEDGDEDDEMELPEEQEDGDTGEEGDELTILIRNPNKKDKEDQKEKEKSETSNVKTGEKTENGDSDGKESSDIDKETEDGDDGKEDGKKTKTVVEIDSRVGGKTEGNEEYIPQSKTEERSREMMETLVHSTDVEYHYLGIPSFNLSEIVVDHSVVIPQMEQDVRTAKMRYTGKFYASLPTFQSKYEEFGSWRQKEKDSISFMVKEFEMKKAAETYQRTSISKTGSLDMSKLHSYKYNEDLFRRQATTPKGKNHGFVMLLDWSGSMAYTLEDTIKQLLSLVLFCRQEQIPFEVYLFRTAVDLDFNDGQRTTSHSYYNTYNPVEMKRRKIQMNIKDHDLLFGTFKLCNILSSRMNMGQLKNAMQILFAAATFYTRRNELSSTPLNQGILALEEIVKTFQKTNRLQVVNTIILTDGGSDAIGGYEGMEHQYKSKGKKQVSIVTDDKTKKTYSFEGMATNWGHKGTEMFLEILKDRTGCNLLGFYLYSGTYKNIPFIDWTILEKQESRDFWSKNAYLPAKSVGYDEYFIVDVKTAQKNLKEPLNVNSNMSKKMMMKEFIKFSGKKVVNRVLLSRFISLVVDTNRK